MSTLRQHEAQEAVRNCIAYAKKNPLRAQFYYDDALQICHKHGLNKFKALVLCEKAKQDIEITNIAIQSDPTYFQGYFIRGMAYKSLGDVGLNPFNSDDTDVPPHECYTRAIKNLLQGYKMSFSRATRAVCEAVVLAVDKDLQYLLNLSTFLTTEECTSIIYSMAIRKEEWQCCHLKYLIAQSSQPGSGVANSLQCSLPEFDWKVIVTKKDFDIAIMENLLSLSASLTHETLQDIVNSVSDDNTNLLNFALKKFHQALPRSIVDSLCTLSIKRKKPKFCSCLVQQGVSLDIIQILLKEFTVDDIIGQKSLCNIIQSSPETCVKFIQSCLKEGNARALEYCKSVITNGSKTDFNYIGIIQAAVQNGKQVSIEFIEWILQEKFVCINTASDNSHLLHAVFELPACYGRDKVYYLLLQYGANVASVNLSEYDKKLILQTVALSALESGDHVILEKCKEQILLVQHQVELDIFLPSFSKPEVKSFLQWLLEQHKIDLTKPEGKTYPLDAALELECQSKEKADLLQLLLKHGAQILCCNTPKKKETTFLNLVTKLAIDTSELILIIF